MRADSDLASWDLSPNHQARRNLASCLLTLRAPPWPLVHFPPPFRQHLVNNTS